LIAKIEEKLGLKPTTPYESIVLLRVYVFPFLILLNFASFFFPVPRRGLYLSCFLPLIYFFRLSWFVLRQGDGAVSAWNTFVRAIIPNAHTGDDEVRSRLPSSLLYLLSLHLPSFYRPIFFDTLSGDSLGSHRDPRDRRNSSLLGRRIAESFFEEAGKSHRKRFGTLFEKIGFF
jgi:hypothetical protein